MSKIGGPRGGTTRIGKSSSEEKRDRIMDVAEDLIARGSPADFQLQEVARELGVKAPALYNHFRGRDDLLGQVDLRGNAEFYALMKRQSKENCLTWLRRCARDLAAFLVKRPAIARLTLWDFSQGEVDWRSEDAVEEFDEFMVMLRLQLEQAAREGVIRDVRPDAFFVHFLTGTAASVLWQELRPEAEASLDQLQDEAEDLVTRLLQPDLKLGDALDDVRPALQSLWDGGAS